MWTQARDALQSQGFNGGELGWILEDNLAMRRLITRAANRFNHASGGRLVGRCDASLVVSEVPLPCCLMKTWAWEWASSVR